MELIKDLILSKEKKSYPVTKELLKAVQEEIERLPRQCRLIFGLFFCGVGPAEVAGIVNRTKKTVMNQRRIACNRLRNALYERGLLSN
jgi:DNA-directed RNA polymerase specialized sigma24 family protein